MKIDKILKQFPLRLALTDYCNLRCFFCSNEGMSLTCKNTSHANLEDVNYLLTTLKNAGLENLSLTGGEPMLYPNLPKLLEFIEEKKISQTFFHTNGVNLDKKIIDKYLVNFTKVAVSIHSVDFNKWQKLTLGTKPQFDKLMSNLDYLSRYSQLGRLLVEIKIVPMKGINDFEDDIYQILEFCNQKKFKFKFLNFEPIVPEQIKYQIDVSSVMEKIKNIGGVLIPSDKKFRGQKSYLPINWFKYKDIKGVVIEIGCGQEEVCKTCYKSNEIFVSPNLEIKPCHAHDFSIPLLPFIKSRESSKILKAIIDSRKFLYKKPGIGVTYWSN